MPTCESNLVNIHTCCSREFIHLSRSLWEYVIFVIVRFAWSSRGRQWQMIKSPASPHPAVIILELSKDLAVEHSSKRWLPSQYHSYHSASMPLASKRLHHHRQCEWSRISPEARVMDKRGNVIQLFSLPVEYSIIRFRRAQSKFYFTFPAVLYILKVKNWLRLLKLESNHNTFSVLLSYFLTIWAKLSNIFFIYFNSKW